MSAKCLSGDSHKHCTKQKDRLAAAFPKFRLGVISRSAWTHRQASASPKGKVGFVALFARGDLQRFIGDIECKYFFVSLHYIQHGMIPFLSRRLFSLRDRVVLVNTCSGH